MRVLLGLLLLLATPSNAGTLTGPVLDQGVVAGIADVVRLPASSIAGALPLARLNGFQQVPDGSGRYFVNDLRGPLHVISGAASQIYLDLRVEFPALKTAPGLASGFVSFSFHPAFASNGLLYTVHTETVGATAPNLVPALPTAIVQHSILTEWQASSPAANVFAGTRRELMRIAAPHQFHNLGEVAFNPNAAPGSPDYGLLYVGAGDFGSVATAQPEQLQRLDTPLGTLMRIDPLGGSFLRGGITYPYGIPAANPFASDGDPNTFGEIYAWGFRNAHRISWDRGGQQSSFTSDIGEDNVEEVNALLAGENYGWPVREGSFALDPNVDPGTVFALDPNDAAFGFRYPVAQYDHDEGSAIAGGFAYRGLALPQLVGRFVFGDIVSGRLFYADVDDLLAADDGDPATSAQVYELGLVSQGQPTSLLALVRTALSNPGITRTDLRFGVDAAGELYLSTKQDGFLRKLVSTQAEDIPAFPIFSQGLQ